MVGEKFGRLTVIQRSNSNKYYFICLCECGNEKEIRKNHLMQGRTKSCGCLNRENHIKHNLYKHPLYRIWSGIKTRCYNKNNKDYKNYGARNIKICEEWLNDPKVFIKWALKNGYKKELSIDRINNNGDYEPNNCKWSTAKEQANNKRDRPNKTGIKYIYFENNKYRVRMPVNGKNKRFGCFNTLEEAVNKLESI